MKAGAATHESLGIWGRYPFISIVREFELRSWGTFSGQRRARYLPVTHCINCESNKTSSNSRCNSASKSAASEIQEMESRAIKSYQSECPKRTSEKHHHIRQFSTIHLVFKRIEVSPHLRRTIYGLRCDTLRPVSPVPTRKQPLKGPLRDRQQSLLAARL